MTGVFRARGEEDTLIFDAAFFGKDGEDRLLNFLLIVFIFLGASAPDHPSTREACLEGTFSGEGHSSPREPRKVKRVSTNL